MLDLQREILAQRGATDPAVLSRALQIASGGAPDPRRVRGRRRGQFGFGPSNVHVDRPLTNLATGYENRELIGLRVMPSIPTTNRSGKYWELDPNAFFKVGQSNMASPRSKPNEVSMSGSFSGQFAVEDYGLCDFVTWDEQNNADTPIQPRSDATEIVTNMLALAQEIRIANIVFASGSYGSNVETLAGGDRWDVDTSDPVKKILAKIDAMRLKPTHAVMGRAVLKSMIVHPRIKEYILGRAATSTGAVPLAVTLQLLADLFGLREVLVGDAQYNSANEGATATLANIWGNHFALLRVEPRPSPRRTQTFGYSMSYLPRQVEVIPDRMPGLNGGDWIKVTEAIDEVVVGGQYAGYLLRSVVSS